MRPQDQHLSRAAAHDAIRALFGQRADAAMWLQTIKAPEFIGFLRSNYPVRPLTDCPSEGLLLLQARKHESTNSRLSPEQFERSVLESYVFWRRTTYMNALRRAMDDANTESNRIDRWLCGRTYSD